jgi:hypothetical protein
LKYIGNPAIEVGDIVIASDGRGNAYSLPVTSIYISNLMSQEIRSAGESHVTTTNTNVSTSVAIEVAKQEAIAYAKYAEIIADRITSGTLDASLITVINMIAQTLTNSADADFYAKVGDVTVDGRVQTGIVGYLKSVSETVPMFSITTKRVGYVNYFDFIMGNQKISMWQHDNGGRQISMSNGTDTSRVRVITSSDGTSACEMGSTGLLGKDYIISTSTSGVFYSNDGGVTKTFLIT